jgi:hypothetical protein
MRAHFLFISLIVVILIYLESIRLVEGLSVEISSTLHPSVKSSSSPSSAHLPRDHWSQMISEHRAVMEGLLYPSSPGMVSLKERRHMVHAHPIYNFLHTYYRYAADSLMVCSPGIDQAFIEVSPADRKRHFNAPYFDYDEKKQMIELSEAYLHKKHDLLQRYFDIMLKTSMRAPNFACFGLHEWAMLYSGRTEGSKSLHKHQPQLDLRVSQTIIDEVVESNSLKCTHFDAWRFFHPEAQPLNSHPALSREVQAETEQPGCIHATMDLFKYAYSIYPYIPATLLYDCLRIALSARLIDMRASPYDVSAYEQCEESICVETISGRKQYAQLQEDLYRRSQPVRLALLASYQQVLGRISSSVSNDEA